MSLWFLWTLAGQKADGITPTHTYTRGGHQPCRLVPCHPSRLAPEEFRAITQQVGLPVGVMTVRAMTVGVLTVGSMGRPPSNGTTPIWPSETVNRKYVLFMGNIVSYLIVSD